MHVFSVVPFPLRSNDYDVLQNEIRKLAYMKRRKMIEAFNLLKVKEGAEFVVREDKWKQLVKLVSPGISTAHRELLLRISDEEQSGYVGKQQHIRLLHVCLALGACKRHSCTGCLCKGEALLCTRLSNPPLYSS